MTGPLITCRSRSRRPSVSATWRHGSDRPAAPRSPGIGQPLTVLFEQTVPEEGSTGATVLAEVDDEDRVARLIVRADRL